MLSTKKLLYKVISAFGANVTYVTPSTGIDGGLRLWRDRTSGTVRCYGYFRKSSDIAQATTIFEIPSGYRPKENYAVPMFLVTSSVETAYYGVVTTAGIMTQSLGNTTRAGMVCGEWPYVE